VVVPLAADVVRRGLAAARAAPRVRRPQCHPRSGARPSGGAVEAGIYQSFNPQGIGIIAASLLAFGTPEQKEKWAIGGHPGTLLRKDVQLIANLAVTATGAAAADADHVTSEDRGDADHRDGARGDTLLAAADAALALMNVSR
jgi:hypothetical protein